MYDLLSALLVVIFSGTNQCKKKSTGNKHTLYFAISFLHLSDPTAYLIITEVSYEGNRKTGLCLTFKYPLIKN